MNYLKQCFLELKDLKYSQENIAELFSIANKVIKFLEEQNPDRKTNTALRYVLLTKNKEFQYFKENGTEYNEDSFKEAKSGIMSDLTTYCREYWDSTEDPWHS